MDRHNLLSTEVYDFNPPPVRKMTDDIWLVFRKVWTVTKDFVFKDPTFISIILIHLCVYVADMQFFLIGFWNPLTHAKIKS
jgi:hypothetical protein